MHNREFEDLIDQITQFDRRAIAKAFTLIESTRIEDRASTVLFLESLNGRRIKHRARRLGISGPPGVGKSTFIESFGNKLLEKGHKIAVLAIDPSSPISGGSILGDKTRMQKLSTHQNVFIRPSPSHGFLGGVARNTPELMMICDAAGFDWILVETVGVGQSEYATASMVDLFLTLQQPNAGDELQGIKKGILEIADLIIVNKVDGATKLAAEKMSTILEQALHYSLFSNNPLKKVFKVSSIENTGIDELYKFIDDAYNSESFKSNLKQKVEKQHSIFFENECLEFFKDNFLTNKKIGALKNSILKQMEKEQGMPFLAANKLINQLLKEWL